MGCGVWCGVVAGGVGWGGVRGAGGWYGVVVVVCVGGKRMVKGSEVYGLLSDACTLDTFSMKDDLLRESLAS